MRAFYFLAVVALAAVFVASAQARTESVPSEVPPDMQQWLDARGLEVEANLETAPAKRTNCWHAKLFVAIRDKPPKRKRVVWAWEKSRVCSWGGRFQTKDVARDKGTPGAGWTDGPNLGVKWQIWQGAREIETYYETDFALTYSRWTVQMDLKQWYTRKVGRSVKWSHGATTPKEGGA